MAVTSAHVNVVDGAAAVVIAAAGLTKKSVLVRRLSNNTEIYLGGSSVTISNGLKLYDETLTFALDIGDSLYAISLPGYGDDLLSVLMSTVIL